MDELCGAVSIYCRNDLEWTSTCIAPADHPPGEHIYVTDPQEEQTHDEPMPDLEAEAEANN